MKINKLFALLVGCYALTACIKDEAPNTEADIESCIVEEDILKRDPQVSSNTIMLLPKDDADITKLPLEFTLSPGATIFPESGTPRDFTTPQNYIVVSEDYKWMKLYTVFASVLDMQTKYDFEHFELIPSGSYNYYKFYEKVEMKRENKIAYEEQRFWDSGNYAAVIIFGSKGEDAFPTVPYQEGKEGYCVKLETKSTMPLGGIMGMRLAAGNLFIGEFDRNYNIKEILKATHFGVPFNKEPIALTGYFKYKAGEVYTDSKGTVMPDMHDTFDIYAILYETDDNVKYLDGTNALTSPNLIAVARIEDKDKIETEEWTYFNLPFNLQPGREINQQKLLSNKYNISVVFSSSIDGASFNGAVGSTLLLDEVELHCKQ